MPRALMATPLAGLDAAYYASKTYEELRSLELEMQAEVDQMQSEVDAATTKRLTTGKWANPRWFRETTMGVKTKRRTIQLIQRLAREKKRATNGLAPTAPFSHWFMNAAREMLPMQQFESVWKHAEALKRGEVVHA